VKSCLSQWIPGGIEVLFAYFFFQEKVGVCVGGSLMAWTGQSVTHF
jgi:hypothetical protein